MLIEVRKSGSLTPDKNMTSWTTEGTRIMKRCLWLVIAAFAACVSPGTGFCESAGGKPDTGKSSTDAPLLPATTIQTEKVISQVMMDKLSNAVSS